MTFFKIATLGCKVNQYESTIIRSQLISAGWVLSDNTNKADYVIVNTCTVTNIAGRKSRQTIRKLQKSNPGCKLIIMGCYSNIEHDDIKSIFADSTIIDQERKTDIYSWGIEGLIESNQKSISYQKHDDKGRLRKVVKVQDGCDQFCSYCIIPYSRNKLVSRPVKEILSEIITLKEYGVREIILTGINLGKYEDLGVSLISMLKQVVVVGFERIRLSSIEPDLVRDELLDVIVNEPSVMPHLHIPLQSGSDEILEKMNRPYDSSFYLKLADKIRSYNINLTTDLIVGFPGETADTFQESKDVLNNSGVSDIHVFKYSPRPGTRAAQMKQNVKGEVIETFLQQALLLKKELSFQYISNQNSFEVLFEIAKDGYWQGLSKDYVRLYVESEKNLQGHVATVKFLNHSNQKNYGTLA